MDRVSSVTFIRKEGFGTENRSEKLSGTVQKIRSKIENVQTLIKMKSVV